MSKPGKERSESDLTNKAKYAIDVIHSQRNPPSYLCWGDVVDMVIMFVKNPDVFIKQYHYNIYRRDASHFDNITSFLMNSRPSKIAAFIAVLKRVDAISDKTYYKDFKAMLGKLDAPIHERWQGKYDTKSAGELLQITARNFTVDMSVYFTVKILEQGDAAMRHIEEVIKTCEGELYSIYKRIMGDYSKEETGMLRTVARCMADNVRKHELMDRYGINAYLCYETSYNVIHEDTFVKIIEENSIVKNKILSMVKDKILIIKNVNEVHS